MVFEIDDLDVTMTWWHRTGVGVYEATSAGLSYTVPEPAAPDDVPTLSPWFQLALMAGLLAIGLGVSRWRAA